MFEFLPPLKKEILIFDDHSTKDLSRVLPKNSFTVLCSRYEKLNIFIIFKCLLKFKFRHRDYLKTYIEYIRPKILITLIDNNIFFYQIKFDFLKKIAVQNGRRTNIPSDIFFNLKGKRLNLYSDYLFTHNKAVSKLYKKYIKSNILATGAVRSNSVKINKKKIYDIGYVSTYRDYDPNMKLHKNYYYRDSIKAELKLIKHLKRYCEEKNFLLGVIGSPENKLESQKEKKYYDKIFGNNYVFFKNHDKRRTYSLVDKFKVLVGIDSTLLYESFGRGNKTVFFSYRKMFYPFNSRKFGWPANLKLNDKFWTSKKDFKSLKKIVNTVYNCESSIWKRYFRKHYDQVMNFDKNNSKLKSVIQKLL